MIEIMIVVAILGILVAIAVPNYLGSRSEAMTKVCKANQRIIKDAIYAYTAGDIDIDKTVNPGGEGESNKWGVFIREGRIPDCPYDHAAYVIGGTYETPTVACGGARASEHNK